MNRPYRLGGIFVAADTPDDWLDELVAEHNNARVANNVFKTLWRNKSLDEVAKVRGDDMVKDGYFGHDDPNHEPGKYHNILLQHFTTWKMAGENLWTGSLGFTPGQLPFAIVRGFLNSPGHRSNVLHEDYDSIGVSATTRPENGWTVVTCIYAGGLVPRASVA